MLNYIQISKPGDSHKLFQKFSDFAVYIKPTLYSINIVFLYTNQVL